MSTSSLDQPSMSTDKRNHLKTMDKGMPFKKMAKLLSKRLTKAKEHEFSLELIDQPWFHGRMTSDYAVKVLEQEGEFLVRENPAKPGDYSFSVNQNGVVKHFPIERSTTKNLKYKFKIHKSNSFENLVDLVGFLYLNKKLVTKNEEIHLRAPASRDTGLAIVVPELVKDNQVYSAPVSPAGSPFMGRRERNQSDPNLLIPNRFKESNNVLAPPLPRERHGSRSSPPSLYVEDRTDNQEPEDIYDTIALPEKKPKPETPETLAAKKKKVILGEIVQMFRKCLFQEFLKHDCLTLAKHMTRRDLEIVWGKGFVAEDAGNQSADGEHPCRGLELILLPQGKQLREKIMERFSTTTVWVSSMIISYGDVADRVEMIKIFIGIAHALYSCLGNLNGFMAVMEGLEVPQVKRLTKTWQRLEENHPKLSIVYHNTLKSLYAILNSHGSNPAPGKVKPCLPYIAHVVKCMETGPTAIEHMGNGVEELDELEVMLNHLRTARHYGGDVESYRRQAVGFMKNMKEEHELDEYFLNTVCVAKSVGLGFQDKEALTKMASLLALMSEHVEPSN